jgi:hypothetical protein
MRELWSMSFQEWNIAGRLTLLDELGIPYEFTIKNNGSYTNDLWKTQALSSGEMEVWKFVTDPVRRVDFSILDYKFGRALLKLHTEFWEWRFKVNEISK